jgi:CRISPR/Cas system CSM-associated protein Csm3 (group 7 of RAMP superfamily)
MEWKTATLKLTTLSPIHIGTGDVFEPTNSVIGVDKGNRFLFTFNEGEFVRELAKNGRSEALLNASSSISGISQFFKRDENFKIIRKIFKEAIWIKGKKVDGDIYRTSKNGQAKAYIPGSSLKGSIATALMTKKYEGDWEETKRLFGIDGQIFKNFRISDSKIIKSVSFISSSNLVPRVEDADRTPLPLSLEAINKGSEFHFKIQYREIGFTLNEILNSLTKHYQHILESDDLIRKFQPKVNLGKEQYLIRVGKYSGRSSVTVQEARYDRMDEIEEELKHERDDRKVAKLEKELKSLEDETTTRLFQGNEPFGWAILEVI